MITSVDSTDASSAFVQYKFNISQLMVGIDMKTQEGGGYGSDLDDVTFRAYLLILTVEVE